MMNVMNKISFEKVVGWLISTLILSFFFYCTVSMYDLYNSQCINSKFLTWDPELRYIITLKMMNFLREGKIFHFLGIFFDSPHWPSLRNAIESLLFLMIGHSTDKVIYFTYSFFVLMPISLLLFLYSQYKMNINFGILFCFFVISLLQSDPLWLYSFTGMLEVQGAYLFPFVSYITWKVFNDPAFIQNKKNGWITFLITFMLYQTKYPYGYMLVLFLVIFHSIVFFKDTWRFGMSYLGSYKTFKKKLLPIFSLILLCFFIFFKGTLSGKAPGYILYLSLLLLLVDFFLFFFKELKEEENLRLYFLVKWILFPIILWIMIQPDRFGSYSGQITHVETQGFNPGQEIDKNLDYLLVFFTEYIMNGFKEFHISYLILFGNLFLLVYGFIDFYRRKEISLSFYFSAISILTFIELSLLTSNRLARHTYHLYPTMILAIVVFVLNLSINKRSLAFFLAMGLLGIVSYPFLVHPIYSLQKTEICYTGYDKNEYITPNWIESKGLSRLNKNTIIYNMVNPFHVNKADTEYLLYKISYDKHLKVLFDPKRLSQLKNEYDEVWITGNSCTNSDKFKEHSEIFKSWGFQMERPEILSSSSGCIQIFSK
jgi:hypothetical protein